MSGSTFGKIYKVTTFGESHGPAIGVVVDGCPANVELIQEDIQKELDRRKPGQSKIVTQRQESDTVEILSGVFEGKTTGASIGLLIRNKDQRSKDYSNIKDIFRPGHADYTFFKKYGHRDYRGGGRSSGRETACRVAAGAIAMKVLEKYGVNVTAYTLAVNGIYAEEKDFSVIEKNIVRAPDLKAAEKMIARIDEARKNCNSLGGIIEVVVRGCPAGLGDPVFDKLDARLAFGLMSIGTVKGVEIGEGFAAAEMTGQDHNDEIRAEDGKAEFKSNHAGGILGGISNGDDITLRVAIKPVSSLAVNQETVNTDIENDECFTKGRHDPCICPRAVPVVEAMIAMTLVDSLLVQKTVNHS